MLRWWTHRGKPPQVSVTLEEILSQIRYLHGELPPIQDDIRIGEIVAYRTWALGSLAVGSRTAPVLVSLTREHIWSPQQEEMAKCLVARYIEHPVPSLNCTCGIYASKRGEEKPLRFHISGTVQLWGTVIEGTTGYRASHARVLSLDAAPGLKQDTLAMLRRLYTPQ